MADTDDLRRLSRAVHRAWADSDIAVLDPLISTTYHHTDVFGRVYDKPSWLRYVRNSRDVAQINIEDETVTIDGDVGIITSTLTGLFPSMARVRVTQVWRREDGLWRRGWYHATLDEPPPGVSAD